MTEIAKTVRGIRGVAGSLSQETLAILAIGVTVLLSFLAGWSSLNGKIGDESAALRDSMAELRRDMNEADQTLRRERREDVEDLRRELRGETRELRGEIRELRGEIRALGAKMDVISLAVAHMGVDVSRNAPAADSVSGATAGTAERG